MRIFLVVFLCLLATHAEAKNPLDSMSPVDVINKEQLERSGDRTVSDLLRNLPTAPAATSLQQQDINLAGLNLRNNLVLLDGKRVNKIDPSLSGFAQDLNTIPIAMLDRVEVLKDGASSLYGSDAIAGVVNIITKKDWNLLPEEQLEPTAFTLQENNWLANKIPIGRLGVNENWGQYTYGLSTYNSKDWAWTPGWKVGETYGLSGPLVALGKTSDGPALSFYNSDGAFIGDVNKAKIDLNPQITSQYLLRSSYSELNPGYYNFDRTYQPRDFDPYAIITYPQGRTLGDTFQAGDMLANNLYDFKGYDKYPASFDQGCAKPYSHELVLPRFEEAKEAAPPVEPNDPFYQKAAAKKKGLIGGVLGGLVNVGAGVLGGGTAVQVDKEGPAVYDQYSLPLIGFTPVSDGSSAWSMVDANTKNVTVAVIDSGLDMAHPDAPQFIWTNDKEIADNNIDDDNNGYVDDAHGWNFLDENNDLKDVRGHGTIVAGIIAARMNNGIGIAGINPGAVIMPLKVLDQNGNTNSLNVFRAVKYAVLNGARVINISIGAPQPSDIERLAINFARSHDVLVVVASGNAGEDLATQSIASIGSALAVGALNVDGSRAVVSNTGPNNSLMAPGEEIYSLHSQDAPWNGPPGMKDRLYTKATGTSFSAPMVTAAASLLLVKDDTLTPDELEDILLSSATQLGDTRWDGRFGNGLLNVGRALAAIDQPHTNVKLTALDKITDGKKLAAVDVYATVRGNIDYFTVELGKGERARKFQPVIGIAGQEASNDLVAHLTPEDLRGSNEWTVVVRAMDKSGVEHVAQTLLTLK